MPKLRTKFDMTLVSMNNLMRMHSSLLVNKKNIVVLADIYAEEGNKAALKGAEYLYKGDRKQAYKYFAIGSEKYLQAAEQVPGKKVGNTTAIDRSLACKKQQNQIEAQLYAGLNEQLGVVNSLKKLKENYLFKDTNKFADSIKEQEKILAEKENEAMDILGVKELNKKEQRGRKIREGVSASDDRSFYEWQTTAYEVKNNYKYEERALKILSRTEQDQFIARKKIYEASGNVDGLIRVSQFISNGSYSADQKIDARLSLATIALAEKNFTYGYQQLNEIEKEINGSQYKNDPDFKDHIKYLKLIAREGKARAYDELKITDRAIYFVKGQSNEDLDDVFEEYKNMPINNKHGVDVAIKLLEHYGRTGQKDEARKIFNKLNGSEIGRAYLTEAKYAHGLGLMEKGLTKDALIYFNNILKDDPASAQALMIKKNFAEIPGFNGRTFDTTNIGSDKKWSSVAQAALKVSQEYTFAEAITYTSTGVIIGGAIGGPKGAAIGLAVAQLALVTKQLVTDWDVVLQAYQTGYTNITPEENLINGLGLVIDMADAFSLGSTKAISLTLKSAKKLIIKGQKKEAAALLKKGMNELAEHQAKYYSKASVKAMTVTLPVLLMAGAQGKTFVETGEIDTEIFKMLVTGKIAGKASGKIGAEAYQARIKGMEIIRGNVKQKVEYNSKITKQLITLDSFSQDKFRDSIKTKSERELPMGIVKNGSSYQLITPDNYKMIDVEKLPYERRTAFHSLLQAYQSGAIKSADKFYEELSNTVFEGIAPGLKNELLSELKFIDPANVEALIARDSCSYTHSFVDKFPANKEVKVVHNHINKSKLSDVDIATGHGLITEMAFGKYSISLPKEVEVNLKIMKNPTGDEINKKYENKLDRIVKSYEGRNLNEKELAGFNREYLEGFIEVRGNYISEIEGYYKKAIENKDLVAMKKYGLELATLEKTSVEFINNYFKNLIEKNPKTAHLQYGQHYEIITYGRLGVGDDTIPVSTTTDYDIKIVCIDNEIKKLLEDNTIKNEKIELVKTLKKNGIDVDHEYLFTSLDEVKRDTDTSNFYPYFAQYLSHEKTADFSITKELFGIYREKGYMPPDQKMYNAVTDFLIGNSKKGKSIELILNKDIKGAKKELKELYLKHVCLSGAKPNDYTFSPKFFGKRMGDMVTFMKYMQKHGKVKYSLAELNKIKKIADFCSNLETYFHKNDLLADDGLITKENFDKLIKRDNNLKEMIIKEAIECELIKPEDIKNKNFDYYIFFNMTEYLGRSSDKLKSIIVEQRREASN